MKAVIVAAGRGSRLMNHKPKTLLPLGESTVLEHILHNLSSAGIREFIIVVGYRFEMIEEYLQQNNGFGLNIQTVFNPEWQRGNGLSVYAAKEAVGNHPFILSMSDHIVSPQSLKQVIDSPRTTNLLLVDPNIERIFDIDDATKVFFEDEKFCTLAKNWKNTMESIAASSA